MSFTLSLQGSQHYISQYSRIETLQSGWVDDQVKYFGLRGQ